MSRLSPEYWTCPERTVRSNVRRYSTEIEVATEKYISYLKYQKNNIESLENALVISYEELTDNPVKTKEKISAFLPLLEDIDIDLKFNAHNMHQKKQMGITNLNQDSIMALSKNQINSINTILNKEQELIKYFKYNIL